MFEAGSSCSCFAIFYVPSSQVSNSFIAAMVEVHATVRDTENLTFSEEFRGCSARNDADCPHGCRGTSAQTGTNLPWGFGLKMAETRRRTSCTTTLRDRETRRKDRSKYHYRNRTC